MQQSTRRLLKTLRQSASTWIEGECKDAIKDLTGLFPTQSAILLNSKYPAAKQRLTAAERLIQQVRWDHLTVDMDALADESLMTVVGQILEIEGTNRQCSPA